LPTSRSWRPSVQAQLFPVLDQSFNTKLAKAAKEFCPEDLRGLGDLLFKAGFAGQEPVFNTKIAKSAKGVLALRILAVLATFCSSPVISGPGSVLQHQARKGRKVHLDQSLGGIRGAKAQESPVISDRFAGVARPSRKPREKGGNGRGRLLD